MARTKVHASVVNDAVLIGEVATSDLSVRVANEDEEQNDPVAQRI